MNLVYTTVFDGPDRHEQRLAARILVSSLLRTGFGGEVVVFTTSDVPLFFIERKDVEEVRIELDPERDCDSDFAALAWRVLGPRQLDMSRYGKAIYLAPDSLVLRNIDHLCEGGWEVAVQPVPGASGRSGLDPGCFAIRGTAFARIADSFEGRFQEALHGGPDASGEGSAVIDPLPALLAEHPFPSSVRIEPGEVRHPLHEPVPENELARAAILRASTGDWEQRLAYLFGQYARRFLWDPRGIVLGLLEP